MKVINIHEAKTHFSKLVEKAAAGKELVIGKAGKPLARLVPYAPKPQPDRVGGQLKGKIVIADDCWAPDEELTAMLTDAPLFPAAEPTQRAAESPVKRSKRK